jgi:hypothetical protein
MTNTIKIKCNAENTLELAELTEFQGGRFFFRRVFGWAIKLIKYG